MILLTLSKFVELLTEELFVNGLDKPIFPSQIVAYFSLNPSSPMQMPKARSKIESGARNNKFIKPKHSSGLLVGSENLKKANSVLL